MKTVTYTESPNGARYLTSKGKQMDIIETLTKEEFEERFPETSTYGLNLYSPIFLENGVILTDTKWNGERYFLNGKEYAPFYNEVEEDTEIIGYYEY